MIARLAIAQVRANKAYSAWTCGLITLLVTILTATLALGATQTNLTEEAARISGWDAPHMGYPSVSTGAPINDSPQFTPAEVADAVADASGHEAFAIIRGDLWIEPGTLDTLTVYATMGEGARIPLVEGRAPTAPGEITIAADIAQKQGLEVGDTVTLFSSADPIDSTQISEYRFDVVGLTSAASLPGFDLWLPSAYISWEEAASSSSPVAINWPLDNGDHVHVWHVSVGWTGHVPSLVMLDENWLPALATSFSLPSGSGAWLGAAIMLVIAMIVMGFAVGRSQASARAQWIATVRTLGARRSTVAVAAALEGLIVAALSAVLGLVLGVGLAGATLAFARILVPQPFGTAVVSMHWLLIPVAAISAGAAALIVTAVPAFWATRVAPTAALKPVNDLTEAEISRRMPFFWVLLPVTVGAGLLWLGNEPSAPIGTVVVAGTIATLVGGTMLVIEVLRRIIPATGAMLRKVRSPGALTAGDELIARPRQGTAAAILLAAGVAMVAVWSASTLLDIVQWWLPYDAADVWGSSELWSWARAEVTAFTPIATVVAGAVTLQVVIAAIAASHRAATQSEETARVAMGLARRQRTLTWWWVQWLPQVIGVCVGLAVGLTAVLAITAMRTAPGTMTTSELQSVVGIFSLGCAGVAGAFALLCGAIAAWLTARLGSRAHPHSR